MRLRLSIVTFSCLTFAPSMALASLLGDTVTIEALFPNSATLFADDVVVAASPAAELTCPAAPGTFEICDSYYTVNATSLNLEDTFIRQDYGNPFSFYQSAAFNGHRFSDLDFAGGALLTGFSLTTSLMGLSAAQVAFTADSIQINLQSLDPSPGDFWQLDLVTSGAAVPEPATVGVLLVGLIALARRHVPRKR